MRVLLLSCICLCVGYAPAVAETPQILAAEAAARFDFGHPYLSVPAPGGLAIVPVPPADHTPELARDVADSEQALAQRGGARWELAARDADLSPGFVDRAFSCAAGVTLSDANTPAIAELVRRAAGDLGGSTSEVKAHYARARPFMVNGQISCIPEFESYLRANGSYPSGHSALGWGIGLVLVGLFPDRAAHLIARGRAFGESRRICNVHWTSDVEEGRVLATAAYARLWSSDAYRADWLAARAEAAKPGLATPDAAKCSAEAAILNEEGFAPPAP